MIKLLLLPVILTPQSCPTSLRLVLRSLYRLHMPSDGKIQKGDINSTVAYTNYNHTPTDGWLRGDSCTSTNLIIIPNGGSLERNVTIAHAQKESVRPRRRVKTFTVI